MNTSSRWMTLAPWLFVGAVMFFIGNMFIFFPLRIFAVFLHESAHALVAILTGGHVVEISLNSDVGGHTLTTGGSRFLTLSAGYLGNLILGGLIMLAAARSKFDKQIAIGIGVTMLVITLLVIKGVFAIVFSTLFGLALIGVGIWAHQRLCDLILRGIGFYSAFYAVLRIKTDLLERSHLHSDARMLAELTGLPTLFWGGLWFLISLAVLVSFVLYAARPQQVSRSAS